MWPMQSASQSTCCSIAWIMLASTEGSGTGDHEQIRKAHRCDAEIGRGLPAIFGSVWPLRPVILILSTTRHAAKPVAQTTASSG
jgi:hypothetical protein